MKTLALSSRTSKEILRDPLNLCFGLGFPIILLLLLSAIQANIPVKMFEINTITPGITVFGLSFISLFSATLISKDRESAFIQRLYTAPLSPFNFILGYALPLLPIAMLQCIICYVIAILLGLTVNSSIIIAILFIIPVSVFFISLGLLFGSILNTKQVGGICGALLTNLTAWLSGIWFDLELVGGSFKKIAYLLPFVHAVKLEKAALNGKPIDIFPHLYWVIGYTLITLSAAIFVFLKQMKR